MLALLAHPAQADAARRARHRRARRARRARAARRGRSRSRTCAAFLEYPIQAWAQAVLGLDELPDDAIAEHSDEPFHLERRAARARCCARCSRAQLRDPGARRSRRATTRRSRELAAARAVPGRRVRRGRARARSRACSQTWRARARADRRRRRRRGSAFGRASSPGAELRPALELELSGGRHGAARRPDRAAAARAGDRYTSVVPLLRKLEKRSPYHLRGAFDHVVLAAAGLAPDGHAHMLLDPSGTVARSSTRRGRRPTRARTSPRSSASCSTSRTATCCRSRHLVERARRASRRPIHATIRRRPRLRADRAAATASACPPDAHAIAQRRLAPARRSACSGDHGFEGVVHDDVRVARPDVAAAGDAIGSSSSRRRPAPARRTSSSTASSI